ncbi:helix-turn-helix domain-containing protein [Luedemannella helvata]|uniref:Helix-turn-helix domain-containing protein n=1 Tax=Luedemannella helvata TaxID=349315 RepID=A0ABP4VYS9_9ACTN
MGASYHHFCPVAKAMELLDERWTLLLVRELTQGSQRFNDLRRGLPRMSPALLSKRLTQLAGAGLVEKRTVDGEARYALTLAGQELRPVVEAIGRWGIRWIGELGDADLDPKLLMWDMHRNVAHESLPDGRSVLQFRFDDVPAGLRDWWLVLTAREADVCDTDPGFPVSVTVNTSLRRMTEIWRGDVSWTDALRSRTLSLQGPTELRRRVPDWFTQGPFAAVPRAYSLAAVQPGERGGS